MDKLETMNITLHAKVADQIRQAVTAGEYRSPGEVIEDALLHWDHEKTSYDLEHLRAAWQEAEADAQEGLDPEPVFARIRKQFEVSPDSDSRQ